MRHVILPAVQLLLIQIVCWLSLDNVIINYGTGIVSFRSFYVDISKNTVENGDIGIRSAAGSSNNTIFQNSIKNVLTCEIVSVLGIGYIR